MRPALYHALAHRADYGRVILLYGARTPDDIVFRKEIERWRSRMDLEVDVTVDAGDGDWRGKVGVVTTLIPRAGIDPDSTAAFVVGPEIMMRFTARALVDEGLSAGPDLDLDGAHHEVRRRAVRPLPVRARR